MNMRAAGEMLLRRRRGKLQSLPKEYRLTINVKLVKSCQNCADSLTRVPRRWMDFLMEGRELVLESCAMVGRQLDIDQVADIHRQSGLYTLPGWLNRKCPKKLLCHESL